MPLKTFRYVGETTIVGRYGMTEHGALITPKDAADEASMLKHCDFQAVTPEDIAKEAGIEATPTPVLPVAPAPAVPAKPAAKVVKSVLAALVLFFGLLMSVSGQNAYVPEEFSLNSSNQVIGMTTNLTYDGPVIDVTRADSINIRMYGLATNGTTTPNHIIVGWVYGTTAQGPWPVTGAAVDFSTVFVTPATNWFALGTNITLNDAGYIKAVSLAYLGSNHVVRARFLTGKKY